MSHSTVDSTPKRKAQSPHQEKERRSNGLARFSGGWTAEDLSEFNEAIRPFGAIGSEDLWR